MAEHIAVGSREFMISAGNGRHPSVASLLVHFAWNHLSAQAAVVAGLHADLALQMCGLLPDDPELSAGLRKLLESRECMIRAVMEKEAK